jgi:DNA (cytosine-5)-methyltransferase 1
MEKYKFPYKWTLKDAHFTKDKGTVFSCFACGGGSTMGYKLAGFDVIGCNEIDPRMNKLYVKNHNPKYNFLCDIREMIDKDLPKDLYNLDILDGSPPCSNFSMAGNREKDWGKKKKFREGQQEQVLDTLFFDFIALAKKLQPKIVVAENVKGLLLGNAKDYVRRIYNGFDDAEYYCQHFLLDGSKMGLPQRRERVFFICLRKDIATPLLYQKSLFECVPKLELEFNGTPIPFREFYQAGVDDRPASRGAMYEYWQKRQPTGSAFNDTLRREYGRDSCFSNVYLHLDEVPQTMTSNADCFYLYEEYRKPNKNECACISSFPQDYDFCDSQYCYVEGMSVPPIMMAQIASEIYNQWLSKLK